MKMNDASDENGRKRSIRSRKTSASNTALDSEAKDSNSRKRSSKASEHRKKEDDDEDNSNNNNNNAIENVINAVVEYVGWIVKSIGKFFNKQIEEEEDDDRDEFVAIEITEERQRVILKVRERLDVSFDDTSQEHVMMLRELWMCSFDSTNDKFPDDTNDTNRSEDDDAVADRLGEYRNRNRNSSSHRSEKWKEMGWQGSHPSTDLRACGIFALENLLYFAKTRKESYERLLKKRDGQRSAWEYPFAAAGVNVTHELTKIINVDNIIRNGTVGKTMRVEKCVLGFFEKHDALKRTRAAASMNFERNRDDNETFHELYCDMFEILDKQWLESKATYMEFPNVLKSAKQKMIYELNKRKREEERALLASGQPK